jgi:hypothetical protein
MNIKSPVHAVQQVISMAVCILGQKPDFRPTDSFKFLQDLESFDKSKLKPQSFRKLATIY